MSLERINESRGLGELSSIIFVILQRVCFIGLAEATCTVDINLFIQSSTMNVKLWEKKRISLNIIKSCVYIGNKPLKSDLTHENRLQKSCFCFLFSHICVWAAFNTIFLRVKGCFGLNIDLSIRCRLNKSSENQRGVFRLKRGLESRKDCIKRYELHNKKKGGKITKIWYVHCCSFMKVN